MPPRFKMRRARGARSVDGIQGLAVRVEGVEETKRALALLPAAVQRKVLRQAMAAAVRPVARNMRAGARAASASSNRREGVGATARAIISKVASSRRDPSIVYGIVGANRGHTELISLQSLPGRYLPVAGITINRTSRRGRHGAIKVTERDLKNLGPIARRARLDTKSNSTRKRTPARYLHLLEKGFDHVGGGRGRAYRFMDVAARESAAESRAKFVERFNAGMHREFQKMAAK